MGQKSCTCTKTDLSPNFDYEKESLLNDIEKDPSAIQNVRNDLKNDKEFICQAIKQNPKVISFLPPEYKDFIHEQCRTFVEFVQFIMALEINPKEADETEEYRLK